MMQVDFHRVVQDAIEDLVLVSADEAGMPLCVYAAKKRCRASDQGIAINILHEIGHRRTNGNPTETRI
jgi:hypothetical protein